MKRVIFIPLLALAAYTAMAVDLTWNPPPPADQVKMTVVQVMDIPSSNITTFSTTNAVITIPGGTDARVFRAAWSNDFGLGGWSTWQAPPHGLSGLKLLVPLSP